MDAGDKFSGAGGDSDVYFWVVPAKTAGAWRSQFPVSGKPQTYEFQFEQQYQIVSGSVQVNGRPVKITDAKLRGAELAFSFTAEVNGASVKHEFSGRVDGGRIIGHGVLSGSRLTARVEWIAERAARVAGLGVID